MLTSMLIHLASYFYIITCSAQLIGCLTSYPLPFTWLSVNYSAARTETPWSVSDLCPIILVSFCAFCVVQICIYQNIKAAAAAAKSLQSCPALCDPIDGSPPGSPNPGILQARTLECVAISFSNAWKWKVKVKSISRVRLCDPMDCSLPGSSVHAAS